MNVTGIISILEKSVVKMVVTVVSDPMKRYSVITIISAFCIIGGFVFVSSYSDCRLTMMEYYANLGQATEDGWMGRGWLPDFLPASASDIRIKIHASHNQVHAAFLFDPSEDIAPMLEEAEELPKVGSESIRAPVICRKEPWFPAAIINGTLEKLTPEGFKFYRIRHGSEEIIDGIALQRYWYLAVHHQTGTCYLWRNW